MSVEYYVAGDWGTTNLRVYLCRCHDRTNSEVIAHKSGLGIKSLERDFESVLFELIGEWVNAYPVEQVILSGMIGSSIGWQEVSYVRCPVAISDLARQSQSFSVRGITVTIVAGLSTLNLLDEQDVMRGEETQLLAWSSGHKADLGPAILALPGTHNKWVLVDKGQIATFQTTITGELFDVLTQHSVLIGSTDNRPFDDASFTAGAELAASTGAAFTLQQLFTVRSRQVLGQMTEGDALWFLSGLLVMQDVLSSLALIRRRVPNVDSVTLVGDGALMTCFEKALLMQGLAVSVISSTAIMIEAYHKIYLCREGNNAPC